MARNSPSSAGVKILKKVKETILNEVQLLLPINCYNVVRFQERGTDWNATVPSLSLEGEALTISDQKVTIFAAVFKEYERVIDIKADREVYVYSPTKNSTRAFCTEGTLLKTDAQGYIDCTVKFGFSVGDAIFVASFEAPARDGKLDVNSVEVAVANLKITSTTYWWAYIQLLVIFLLIFLAFVLSIFLVVYVCLKPTGTKEMQKLAKYISDGASGFLRVQYIAVGIISLPVALVLFFVFLLRPKSHSDPDIPQAVYGVIVALSFLFGVLCSAVSGCIGMFISVRTNIRVAAAAMTSYRETVNIAVRGGAFASFCFVALSCFGVTSMFGIFFVCFPQDIMNPVQICTVIIGFSFGASFSALFAQLGGGIFTKAADVGADIVGKVEKSLPEDDVRNPAVIADLVGDNVGDCAGRGADLFESISANCFGTMILGSSLALNAVPQLSGVYQYVLFPLLVLSFGMISSFVGLFCIRVGEYKVDPTKTGLAITDDGATDDERKVIRKVPYDELHDEVDGTKREDEEEEMQEIDQIGHEVFDQQHSINADDVDEGHQPLEDEEESNYEGGEQLISSEDEEKKTDDYPAGPSDSINAEPIKAEIDDDQERFDTLRIEEEGELPKIEEDDVYHAEEDGDLIVDEGLMDEDDEERKKKKKKKKNKFSGCRNPIFMIGVGFLVCFLMNCVFYFGLSFWCFFDTENPNAWWCYSLCGIVGIAISFCFVFITVYYTDYGWRPTRSIAKASETGAATNVITGCAVGFESAAPSTFVICVGILFCFYFGELSGIQDIHGNYIGGFYGISCGTMGMLSTSCFILALDTFGPIADNAGGIVEMAGLSEEIREITDRLDAVGNTTKALTKGYAVGTAALAGCLLFFAFLDTVSNYAEVIIDDINISRPEVFVGGLLGAATVFLFVSITLRAVGSTAAKIVKEVRSQFKKNPGIMTFECEPNYKKCVAYCTINALISMIIPGLIGTFTPVLVGFVFRFLGWLVGPGNEFMGVTVTTGYLIVATITSVLMGMFLNNSGGAWDNAKKYVETKGKDWLKNEGKDAHDASIVGDTVGDPFKDCAGPSLHVLIKLLATVALVIGPLWIDSSVINSD